MKEVNKHFSGYFETVSADYEFKNFYIERVLYNDPVTIVFWSDNTKTVSKCHGGDKYSPEMGLTVCVLKKIMGGKAVRDLINDWTPEISNNFYAINNYKNVNVTVKDVRRKHKED